MQTDRATAKPRKAKRISPPKGKGPLAPKPQGVFAAPVRAPSVKDKPASPTRSRSGDAPKAVLDVLPTRKGENAKPYTPPVAKTVVRKARRVRAAAQADAKDTKGNAERQRAATYLDAHPEILHPKKPGKGDGGSILATITGAAKGGLALENKLLPAALHAAIPALPRSEYSDKLVRNIPSDTAEIVTTTPTSLVKLGDTTIHHPKQVPGMLAQPYKELLKDPGHFVQDHPVSTFLMLDPALKVPGRIVGKGLRVTGKQTLERPAATLPGTALKETRPASRDAVVNAAQKRRDVKAPAPTVTPKQIARRVDEFHDFAQHKAAQIVADAQRKAAAQHQHLPKAERRQKIQEAVDAAHEGARAEIDARFVREFGANARPAVGSAERGAAATVRERATKKVKATRIKVEGAKAEHQTAMTAARLALARSKTSPALKALEREHRAALQEVARAKQSLKAAQVRGGVAKGRSQILSRNVGGAENSGAGGSYGMHLASQEVTAAGARLKTSRAVAREVEGRLSAQRARVAGVPPAEHDALMRAAADESSARAELATARTTRETARAEHIRVKRAMSAADLVDPESQGRLFEHKGDARQVIKKLPGGDESWAFMNVGDRYAVVPKDAKLRLGKQRAVGTSPATMAKVMRRSRGALTQAVLPLSAKWLMGQGVEAGVRSVAAGAGPADLLRFRNVVKKLNADKPGSGDELLMRVSGGQFGLTGTAREFAQGQRSLADEFAGTSLERVGNAATKVGNVLPAKAVRKGWSKYTNVMLNSINGVLENTARKAMAGHGIKATFGDHRVLTGLSEKAIDEAAKGLTGTESQVALGRAVDRMYGQYQKFSPDKRSLLLHWTPFLPWYLNTAKFLFRVLPADHPIKTALLADVDAATEQWRKDHGLSLRGGATKPAWMLGGYPSKAGIIPVGKFTPFGVGTDVPGAVAGLTLPQLLGPIKNAGGVDWKWQEMSNGYDKPFTPTQKGLRALVTAVESQVPGVAQGLRISGVERKYVDRKPVDQTARQSVLKMLNPLTPIPNTGQASTSGGSTGNVPGVSQAEIDQLIREASSPRAPVVSQKEIDALIKAQLGG